MAVKFVIIGGGPAGNQAATYAARLGAEVTVIERDVIGGAAHLWDCIPSKTMIATGGAMSFARRIEGMGLEDLNPEVDLDGLRERIAAIETRLHTSITTQLLSQGVRIINGSADVIVEPGGKPTPFSVTASAGSGSDACTVNVSALPTWPLIVDPQAGVGP